MHVNIYKYDAGYSYFKSTDGHFNHWDFSKQRLNLNVYQLACEYNGVIIVDSTRRGKSFPDSLSKTVPIWCCVLNRFIYIYVYICIYI